MRILIWLQNRFHPLSMESICARGWSFTTHKTNFIHTQKHENPRVSWSFHWSHLIICTVFSFYGLIYNVEKMQMTSHRIQHTTHSEHARKSRHKHTHSQRHIRTQCSVHRKALLKAIIFAKNPQLPWIKYDSEACKNISHLLDMPDGTTGILIDFMLNTEPPFR